MGIRGQLISLSRQPGLWSKVPPHRCDDDLALMIREGLVQWRGEDSGYEITDAGRVALAGKEEG